MPRPAWDSAPAVFYGGAFDVIVVIWGMPSPLLAGAHGFSEVSDAFHARATMPPRLLVGWVGFFPECLWMVTMNR